MTDTERMVRSAARLAATGGLRRPRRGGRVVIPELLRMAAALRPPLKRYVAVALRVEAVTMPAAEVRELRRNFTRAGARCVCEQCGLPYADHPADVEPEDPADFSARALTILCDRSRVKL
jgi:hypothetical protein